MPLNANTADSIVGGLNITETDPIFSASIANGITGADTTNWNNHFNGQYNGLTGTPTNVSSFTNDAAYITTEIDGSSTNEIQVLSISNDTVYLSNGDFLMSNIGVLRRSMKSIRGSRILPMGTMTANISSPLTM
jgi:hypothetical protein